MMDATKQPDPLPTALEVARVKKLPYNEPVIDREVLEQGQFMRLPEPEQARRRFAPVANRRGKR